MAFTFSPKFFKILQTLSAEELKSFEQWLSSPWCNTNKNLVKLLHAVTKYHPNYDHPKLTKERLFKKILPNGKFSDRRMNNLLSEGYLAAERFLIFQNLTQNRNLQNDLLTQELQNRHLEDWFFKNINKEITKLEKTEVKEWEDHMELFRLYRRVYHHPNQNPRMQPGGSTIVKMGEYIDLIYLLEKAAIINEKIFRNRILKNENHDVTLELANWRKASQGVDHLAIEFYRKRFDYTEEKMLEQYYKLRKTYLEEFENLNKKEQKIHLFSLINDTKKLIRRQSLDIGESLPLYKLGLKTEMIFTEGKLTHITYFTIVTVSNAKKDFEFTSHFIENYTKKVDTKYQDDVLNWANAHTAYRKENLLECLDILLNYQFKSTYFRLMTKSLTSQTYFDLYLENESYQTYLFNYFDSFEKWLQREKFSSATFKKGFLKFVQKSRTLAKLYSSADFYPEEIESLLEGESNVQATTWLSQRIEKVLRLKKRRLSNN